MASRNATEARAVLWDLDGTLVDSADQHWQAWREVLADVGVTPTHEQFLASFGRRNDEYLPDWLGPGASPDDITRLGHAKEARYRELVARDGLTALPGAAEWVARLAAAGWHQAIASSAPRANVVVVVDALGLADHFAALVAAEDVQVGKPGPDVFLAAARAVDTPPARCVVVEDAPAGVEAARRAGMPCIGVGGRPLPEATLVVESLVDLSDDAFETLIEG